MAPFKRPLTILQVIPALKSGGVEIETLEIEKINGESPKKTVLKIGNLFASDGYIKAVKFSDLEGFNLR